MLNSLHGFISQIQHAVRLQYMHYTHSNIVYLQIPGAEVANVIHIEGNEWLYNNHFYDVVAVKIQKKMLLVTAFDDATDKNNLELEKKQHGKKLTQTEKSTNLFCCEIPKLIPSFFYTYNKKNKIYYCKYFPENTKQIIVPPPCI